MNDPQKLAALAALVGVTPETHGHLTRHYCIGCGATIYFDADSSTKCCDDYTETEVSPDKLPGLDTPAGDDVFLAPVMRWLARNEYEPLIIGDHVGDPCWACITKRTGDTDCGGSTFTAALIRACQSAGVPEICAIFGSES